jgi:hypothetical protein
VWRLRSGLPLPLAWSLLAQDLVLRSSARLALALAPVSLLTLAALLAALALTALLTALALALLAVALAALFVRLFAHRDSSRLGGPVVPGTDQSAICTAARTSAAKGLLGELYHQVRLDRHARRSPG